MSDLRSRTNRKRCARLTEMLRPGGPMLIVLQDSPDPDALAAAAALRLIANQTAGVPCTLAHGGIIGRAENAALVRYLGLSPRRFAAAELDRYALVALVDTQPGTGNNPLPVEYTPSIVIDHHPVRRLTRSCPFTDIRRRYGATSTILCEYLQTFGIQPDRPLATALLYGIRSDTQDLGREACQADIDAHLRLYPLANLRMLARIQTASVPRDYFQALGEAMHSAEIAGKAVFCALRKPGNADIVPEIADLLLRYEEAAWVLVCGVAEGRLVLSLRCRAEGDADAGKAARRIVGRYGSAGGHQTMAGGQIPLGSADPRRAMRLLRQRYYRVVGSAEFPRRHLVESGAHPDAAPAPGGAADPHA